MSQILPPTIATYIEASNSRDSDTLIDCFAPNATVADEDHTHCGADEIRAWFAETVTAYGFTTEALEVKGEESTPVVTCRVTGAFPGSPVQLRFCFTLENDKIVALSIHP